MSSAGSLSYICLLKWSRTLTTWQLCFKLPLSTYKSNSGKADIFAGLLHIKIPYLILTERERRRSIQPPEYVNLGFYNFYPCPTKYILNAYDGMPDYDWNKQNKKAIRKLQIELKNIYFFIKIRIPILNSDTGSILEFIKDRTKIIVTTKNVQ